MLRHFWRRLDIPWRVGCSIRLQERRRRVPGRGRDLQLSSWEGATSLTQSIPEVVWIQASTFQVAHSLPWLKEMATHRQCHWSLSRLSWCGRRSASSGCEVYTLTPHQALDLSRAVFIQRPVTCGGEWQISHPDIFTETHSKEPS